MSTNKLTLFRFAKKALNLTNQEKGALIAIADAQGDINGTCWASISNMAADYGRTKRSLQRGIHGYSKKDKKAGLSRVVAQGLVNRGLIYALGSTSGGSHANTTKWRINVEKLLEYLPETHADKLKKLLDPTLPTHDTTGDTTHDTSRSPRVTSERVTGDKRAGDGCHSAPQPPNTAPPKSNSLQPTGLDGGIEEAVKWVRDLFEERTGQVLSVKDAASLFESRLPEAVKGSVEDWLNRRDRGGMKNPAYFIKKEFPVAQPSYWPRLD